MAINDTQKVDYLWKKLGYGVSKTDVPTVKNATNESVPSPLLIRGDRLWSSSGEIPVVIPTTSTSIIEIYSDSGLGNSTIECSPDLTSTTNRTWFTNLTDWIPPEFGSTYQVKVYIDSIGSITPQSTGDQIFASGSGSNDEWFFDYQSGILHFIGDNLPSGISGNSIFVSGARYVGPFGSDSASANIGNFNIFDNTITTTNTDGEIILDPNGSGRIFLSADTKVDSTGAITIPVGTTLERPVTLEQGMIRYNTTDATFEGYDGTNWGSLGGVKDVDQDTYIIAETSAGVDNDELDFYTAGTQRMQIGATGDILVGTTLSEFTIDQSGNTNITGTLDVADEVRLSSTLDVTGNTTLTTLDVSVQANFASASVSDLTDNRIVIAGALGELEDDANFRFDGTDFLIGSTGSETFTVNVATGNTFVGGTLTVDGATSITGDLSVNNLDAVTLDVSSDTTLGGSLTVTGQSTFNNSMTALDISATSLTTTSDVTVGGAVVVTGNITGSDIDGSAISVTGNADVGTNLSVVGTTVLNSDVTINNAGDFAIRSTAPAIVFGVDGATGNTTIAGTLDVEGQTSLTSLNVEDLTDNRIVIAGLGGELEDSADLTFDGTTFVVGTNAFTVDATSGDVVITGNLVLGSDNADVVTINSDINGNIVPSATLTYDLGTPTDYWRAVYAEDINVSGNVIIGGGNSGSDLDVSGQSTFDSVNVEDLTEDRIVIAGVNGELEDDPNFTFDGTTFKVGTNITDKFTVDVATGNISTLGTIDVDSEATLASAIIEDLTDNRVLIAGAGGAVEDDANFTFDGTTLNVGANNFTVDVATGNTSTLGELSVASQATFASANVQDLTNARIIFAGTNGELIDSADLTFNGTTLNVGQGNFTVDIANGNTLTSGNLTVTGDLLVNGTTTTVNSTTVTIDDPIFTLGGDTAPALDDNKDRGIEFRWHDGVSAKVGFFGFDDSAQAFTFIPDGANAAEVFSGTPGDVIFGASEFTSSTIGNIQVGITDANTIDTTVGILTLNSASGIVDIPNSLTVGVEATLTSASVTDLTADRIVYAGTNGALQDSANLTFDNTTLTVIANTNITGAVTVTGNLSVDNINIDTNTISSTDANGNINITPNGSGEVVASSLSVSDLTSTHLAVAGTGGALEGSANLTFDGSDFNVIADLFLLGALDVTGSTQVDNILIDGNTISSTDLNGAINLTPNGTGEVVASTLSVSDLTDTRIIFAGTSGALQDDANFRFDGTDFLIGPALSESFTVNATTGNTDVSGTLNVVGQTTLSSVNVLDLTSDRVLLAGTNGELEDSANLTFNGTLFTVTGNANVTGTLNVDGQTNLGSLNVEDLTENRIVIAGVNGELEDDANFTFDGTTLAATATFNLTGNQTVSGTLDVDGQTTLASVNVEDLTDNRILIAGASGEIEDDPSFRFDGSSFNIGTLGTETFSVEVLSGNTSISGTLGVDGATTITGTLDVNSQATFTSVNVEDLTPTRIVLAGVNGELEDSNNLTFDGSVLEATATFNLTGNQTVSGTLDVDSQLTATSLNVEDLTDNRIVIAGASGELEDSASLTFDGTTLAVGVTNFTVNATTGNTAIAGNATVTGTLDVNSQGTIASLNVEDLTSGRVVIAGASGELEDSASLTFDGTDLTASSLVVSDLTDNRIVIAGTAGAVEDSADFTFDGTALNVGQGNFTVNVATGNVTTAGNISITGDLTVNGTTTTVNSTTVTVDDPIFTLGGDTAPTVDDNKDRGIEFRWHDGSSAKVGFFGFDDSTGKFTFIPDGTNTSEVFSGTTGDVVFGNAELDSITTGNIQVGVTNSNTIDTIAGDLTLDSTGGTVIVNDNLIVTGEATLASAIVSDLTENRLVLAGTLGSLEDSANLTYNGTTFAVVSDTTITGAVDITGDLDVDNINIDGNTISSTDIDGNISITPNGAGEVIASTLSVNDLTENRLVVAGTTGSLEDSADLTFDGTSFAIGTTNFTVDATNGNTTIAGTLSASETTLSSASVSDLTNTRIVLAGIAGALEDNVDLTFDGTTLNVGQGNFTVDATNGNTAAAGTFSAGETTVSSATVSDLTDNRIVIAGAAGALEDDANFRFDGVDFEIGAAGSETFSVNVATGNTTVAGTLSTSDATFTSAAVSDLTDNRLVIAGASGELEDDANLVFDGTTFNIGTNSFTVDTTGNTVVGGTLDITGNTDIASVTGSTSTTTGALTVAGGAGINENLYVGGNVSITGTLGADGGVTLGDDAATDVLTLNARITGSVTPSTNDLYDLGSNLLSWRDAYLSESLNFTGLASGDNEIVVPSNFADALSITESSGDIIVINTSTGARSVTVETDLQVNGNLTLSDAAGSTGVAIILDEDTMASDRDDALATQQSIKAYVDNAQSDLDLNIAGDAGTGTVNILTQSLSIAGTANEIETSAANQTITIGLPNDVTVGNNLTVTNNLTVNGGTATLAVDSFSTDDPIITIGGTTAPLANDGLDKGIEFRFFDTSARTGFFGYDISQDAFTFVKLATNNSEVITGTAGDVVFGQGTFAGVITGNVQTGVTNGNTIDTSSGNLVLDSASGTVEIADQLSVTNEAVLSSATVSDLTDNRIVIAGPSGSLEDDANFKFDGATFNIGPTGSETFAVTVTTGDTAIAGTLNANGQTNLNGNTTIGSDATDTVNFTALVNSSIRPSTTDTNDLGDTSYAWRDLYLSENVLFRGATSENEIVVPTNQADALSIVDNALTPNDLIVFDTTSNNQLITIVPDLQLDGALTINGGVSVTTILDEDTMVSDSATALATQQSIKAYVDNSQANLDLNIAGDTGTGTVNLLTETFTLQGTANEIETTASGQTITVGLPDSVTITSDLNVGGNTVITGNLTVNGTTTTVSTTELVVSDNIITLNEGETGAGVTAGSSGIEIDRGTEATKSWVWDEANDRWTAGTDAIEGSEFYGTIDGGTF